MCAIIEKKGQETKVIISNLEKDLREIKKKTDGVRKEIKKENALINDDGLFTDWNKILNNVRQRKNDTCAICFCALDKKQVYLLNCTHCFHKNCLDSFEKFDTYYEKRCPICRGNYEKKEFKF
jgi:hypothetical protein